MKAENYLKSFWGLIVTNRPRYGAYIVHIAIILIAIGVIGSSCYDVEKEAMLMPGESMTIKNYTLTYENLNHYETQSKLVVTAALSIYNSANLGDIYSKGLIFYKSLCLLGWQGKEQFIIFTVE